MKVALTGGTGYLGSFLIRRLLESGIEVLSFSRKPHSLFPESQRFRQQLIPAEPDRDYFSAALESYGVEHLVHCAAMTSPAACEKNPRAAHASNLALTASLADACRSTGCYLCFISSDLVFDGLKAPEGGFVEKDAPRPCSVYAQTKAQGEDYVLKHVQASSVLRVCLLIGESIALRSGPMGWIRQGLGEQRPVTLFHDEFRTPVWVEDVVRVITMLCESRITGVYHCGGPERLSRVELGRLFCQHSGASQGLILEQSRQSLDTKPARPEDVSLCSRAIEKVLGIQLLAPASVFQQEFNKIA